MRFRTLCKYFDTVVKPQNFELTQLEKKNSSFSDFNPQDKVARCYLCEFPIDPRFIHRSDTNFEKFVF